VSGETKQQTEKHILHRRVEYGTKWKLKKTFVELLNAYLGSVLAPSNTPFTVGTGTSYVLDVTYV
jgi:hypothetical protein